MQFTPSDEDTIFSQLVSYPDIRSPQRLALTSMFLLIRPFQQEVFALYMSSCNSRRTLELLPVNVMNSKIHIKDLLQFKKELHSNVDAAPIGLDFPDNDILRVCITERLTSRTPPHACAFLILSRKNNFSIKYRTVPGKYNTVVEEQPFSWVYTEKVLTKEGIEIRFINPTTEHHTWISYGCYYNRYRFATFIEQTKRGVTLEVLLEPLEIWLWISTLLTMLVCVVLVHLLTIGRSDLHWLGNFRNVWVIRNKHY
jgi:hypothetical protein